MGRKSWPVGVGVHVDLDLADALLVELLRQGSWV
jgi:hypothetical protein